MEHHDDEHHDDDKPIGRLLSRREVLKLFGGAGAATVFVGAGFSRINIGQLIVTTTPTPDANAVPSCVVKPELTEGPYFVDDQLNRSDIRIDPSDDSIKEGAVLRLKFHVTNVTADTCMALAGAQVDIWHCDALGVYSGVSDPGFDTSNQTWLRGYQVTDENGMVEFITIYPGWYSGRTVHIHFKIRTDPDADTGYEFTSQLFFDEELTDVVYTQAPYSSRGTRNTYNEDEGIFQGSEGLLTLAITETEDEDDIAQYEATFDIGLDLTQPTQSETGGSAGGNRPGGRP